MKLCPSCMSEREEHEFYADPRVRGGLSKTCRACLNRPARILRASRKRGEAQQRVIESETHSQLPPDWRVAGTAFQVNRMYARSFDGDWWRVSGTRLRPVFADEVSMRVLPTGRRKVEQIVGGE